MDLLRDKDATTRRIYTYLASKFLVADQYAQAILWVIQTQVPNAATLDCDKVSSILNHIKDTIGYPTWFSVHSMFKAAFVLSVFDHYAAFHYKYLGEMSSNYPEFSSLSIQEQHQLLNYRNYLVVAIKVFDPNVRSTDLLNMIEQICGYTTWEYTAPSQRERRELIFFRVTGVVARFEVPRYPDKKNYRSRPKKPTKTTPVPAQERLRSQSQEAGVLPSILSNSYPAEMASSVLHKRPNQYSSYAYYTKQQRADTTVCESTPVNAPCNAAEAAYLHLRALASSEDECEDAHIDYAEVVASINNTELSVTQTTTTNTNNDVEQTNYSQTKEQAPRSTRGQATLRPRSVAEEAARNVRMKIFLRRLAAGSGDASGAPVRSASALIPPAYASAEGASDVATVSSDEVAPVPVPVPVSLTVPATANTSSASDGVVIDTPKLISHVDKSVSSSAKLTPTSVTAVVPHIPVRASVPASATTSGCNFTGTASSAVPVNTVISSLVYPYDTFPVRPPLPHSALAFGLQSMHAVLNAHLGLLYSDGSNGRVQPPPSPAYDIDYPQPYAHNAISRTNNGFHVSPYRSNPYNANASGGHGSDANRNSAKGYGAARVLAFAPPNSMSSMPACAPSTGTSQAHRSMDGFNTQHPSTHSSVGTPHCQQQQNMQVQRGSNMMQQQQERNMKPLQQHERILMQQQRQQHDRNVMQQQLQQQVRNGLHQQERYVMSQQQQPQQQQQHQHQNQQV